MGNEQEATAEETFIGKIEQSGKKMKITDEAARAETEDDENYSQED